MGGVSPPSSTAVLVEAAARLAAEPAGRDVVAQQRRRPVLGVADLAVAVDPEQPEYLTLLVWIRAQRRGDPQGVREGTTSTHFDDLIKTLDDVVQKEPRFERALYYRGVLLKRAGRVDKAIRDFRMAAQLNPKNLDAIREVRLYEMRKRGGPGKGGPGGKGGGEQDGLFGKFFKR